jgi:hypothetical protein
MDLVSVFFRLITTSPGTFVEEGDFSSLYVLGTYVED